MTSHRLRTCACLAAAAGFLGLVTGASGAGDGGHSFAPGAVIPTGLGRGSAAVADLNGDGRPDLAVANSGSNDVTILLGNGAGGFSAPGSTVAVGEAPASIAAADVNRDGKADLAIANYKSKDLTVLLGNGEGGFSAAAASPVKIGATPVDLVLADLNGDGKLDGVVPASANRVVILLGDGLGGFAPAPGSPVAAGGGYGPDAVVVADFSGDGKPDLAGGNSESKKIWILRGNGTGGFAAGGTVLVRTEPSALAVADFNRDGRPDLAAAGQNLTILLGNGAAGFRRGAGNSIALGDGVDALVAADLNGDGKTDLVADPGEVTVLLGDGRGTFRSAKDAPFSLPSSPALFSLYLTGIVSADLNGDLKPDLALPAAWTGEAGTQGGVAILWQTRELPRAASRGPFPGTHDAVFSTRGSITVFAADGSRAAVVPTMAGKYCGRILVWTAPRLRTRSFEAHACASILCRSCVTEAALGGGQLAWISIDGGNTEEMTLRAARLSGGAAKELEFVTNGQGAGGDPEGDYVGRLLGSGPLLAYSGWTVVCGHPEELDCDGWGVAKQRLVRITARRKAVVGRGSSSYALSAVGGGRMAVESTGTVGVLARNGSHLSTVPAVEGNPPRAIALSRTHLVVERTFTLDLYNPATGAEAKSIPLGTAAALRLAGASAKLALLRGSHRLVLVRLRDGKLISLPLRRAAATGFVGAHLTGAGLFYAYNLPRGKAKGRVVFEGTAKLLARF